MIILGLVPAILLAVALRRARSWGEPMTRRLTIALTALAVASGCTVCAVTDVAETLGARHFGLGGLPEFISHVAALIACGAMLEWSMVSARHEPRLPVFRVVTATAVALLVLLYAVTGLSAPGGPGILAAGTLSSRAYALVYAGTIAWAAAHLAYLMVDAIRRRTGGKIVCAALGFASAAAIVYSVGVVGFGMIPTSPEMIIRWTWLTAGPSLLGFAVAGAVGWFPGHKGSQSEHTDPDAPRPGDDDPRFDRVFDLRHIEVATGTDRPAVPPRRGAARFA
ncbi:hypothetical protein IU433_26335 [Nocardia puris]|uniref:hypothetical protein n=1 Tax=Nocardia puris TaxID=208602 RepID=UPI0018947BF9|nr:hypothetical protein [Nocardia puris]MBF6462533.1 hypothetical protein [Nocardia puris]